MTTTACAMNSSMLTQLNLQTVICEEAGEVMEAQTICTLFPSVKHAIFIGDPLQLRPQVNEQALSLETAMGTPYRLDESLMERMMIPSTPEVRPIASSCLDLQRRMHPEIANLMRATLYPFLQDHEVARSRGPVAGMLDRVWWLDHKVPEDTPDSGSLMAKSFSNAYEVEMVVGLVEYLINSNEYSYQDITILTPYNGQLAAFTQRLKGTCSLWLSEKDRESLIDDGLLDPEETPCGVKIDIGLGSMLRLATIDNFQGEESKVVILSTVRSNSEGRVGFLKTPNRINVACSRAKNGFYVVGNSTLMSAVPMWRQIARDLSARGRIGPAFRVCCSRHPNKVFHVQSPEQWYQIPECEIRCGSKLPCGELCTLKCHAAALHDRIGCPEPCSKYHQACGGTQKDEKIVCNVRLDAIQLTCGPAICHAGGECPPCRLPCTRSCGHGSCSRPFSHICDPCVKTCDASAACFHKGSCTMMCCLPCNQLPCSEPCPKVYLPCRHLCPSLCGELCPAVCPVCRLRDLSQKTYMFLPCGHHFELEYLDRHLDLNNIYVLDTTGNVQKVASDALSQVKSTDLACPTCGESCKNIRRYALHYQLVALEGNIDRMHAKLSRKMNMFMEQLYGAKIDLDKSFNDFQKRLKPGPLAGRSNADLVRHRGNTLAEIQSRILDFKDDVVQRFEDNIAHLAVFLDISPVPAYEFPNINLWYRLRFEVLFVRSRLIILEESLRMLGALRSMNDDSEHTSVLIRGLRSLTQDEANQHILSLNKTIAECDFKNLKRLEAEARLMQVGFHILLGDLGAASDLGCEASLNRILSLCSTFPDTAGVLLTTYTSFKMVVNGKQCHGNLYTRGSKGIWWSWPAHKVGSLKQCVHGHQYSTSTWPGCPECGREVMFSPEPKAVDSKDFLNENAFVAAMRKQTFSAASYRV